MSPRFPSNPPTAKQPPSSNVDMVRLLTREPRSDPADRTHQPFRFPTLSLDGAVQPPAPRQTPPAALSSLGASMARNTMSDSISSLEDGSYDMVDDISELSSDDRETASLASSDLRDDHDDEEGRMTPPEDAASIIDLGDKRSAAAAGAQQPGVANVALSQLPSNHLQDPHASMGGTKAQFDLDDNFTDDLETPRQSTIAAREMDPANKTAAPTSIPKRHSATTLREIFALPSVKSMLFNLILVVFVGCSMSCWLDPTSAEPSLAVRTRERQTALAAALVDFTNSPDGTRTFNITHLLPEPTLLRKDVFGSEVRGTTEIRYQGAPPNYLVISLPRIATGSFPTPYALNVTKGSRQLLANYTALIRGVYGVVIDPHEAHGVVSVSMLCKRPQLAVTVAHHFGNRMLQRLTYEKARTDLSKTVAKDVAVAREVAKAVSDKVQLDVHTGVERTRDVASVIVRNVAHDLVVFAGKAVDAVGKVHEDGRRVAGEVRKDITTLRRGIEEAVNDAAENLKTFVPTTRMIKDPILSSRERAVAISDRLLGRREPSGTEHQKKPAGLSTQSFSKDLMPGEKGRKKSTSHSGSWKKARGKESDCKSTRKSGKGSGSN